MALSIKMTASLTAFLILGMALASIIMQPQASSDAWNVKESDFPASGTEEERLTFLLRYAILAPSSYNTQPWSFFVNGSEIQISADRSRWLQVADADMREQNVSLGCALENLLLAAEHFGYSRNITYFPGYGNLAASVNLSPNDGSLGLGNYSLFQAILTRRTSTNPYESREVPESALQLMGKVGGREGIEILLVNDSGIKSRFRDLVVAADRVLYSDINYRSELGHWLGQGMMGPSGIQALLAQLEVDFLDPGPDRTRRDADLVNSTPILGFIISQRNDRISQIKAGQSLERVWLAASAGGMALQPMSQVLEVPGGKTELCKLLPGEGTYLQQVFCLGFAGAAEEHTPRRPLEDFLIKEQR